jgi:hypothetical protein
LGVIAGMLLAQRRRRAGGDEIGRKVGRIGDGRRLMSEIEKEQSHGEKRRQSLFHHGSLAQCGALSFLGRGLTQSP